FLKALSFKVQNERIFLGGLPQSLEPTGGPAVSGLHIGVQKKEVSVRFIFPELGHPFGRFPILHLGIVQSGGDIHMGIGLGLHIVIGGIGFDIIVIFLVVGVAPFIILPGGQGNGVV